MYKGTIDLDAARAERAAANPDAPPETPATLMFDDPERFAAEHPEAAARIAGSIKKLMDGLVFEAPVENWEKDARPILRRMRAERKRRGDESAWRLLDLHRRQRSQSSSGRGTRAPRATAPRVHGSRRTGASSSTSSTDPGDPEPKPRLCGGCGEPLIGKAPQARYHDDACRMKARRLAAKPHRPIWTESEIIALALAIEPFPVIAGIMEEPPGGYVPPRRWLAREWAMGPGQGHRAPVRHSRMAVVA